MTNFKYEVKKIDYGRAIELSVRLYKIKPTFEDLLDVIINKVAVQVRNGILTKSIDWTPNKTEE